MTIKCTKLMAEKATKNGLATLWKKDVAPSNRHDYEIRLGANLVVIGDREGEAEFKRFVAANA